MNTISVDDKLAQARRLIEEAEAEQAEHSAAPSSVSLSSVGSSTEVTQAAANLARVIAKQSGADLPMQAAEGLGELPVIEVPEQFRGFLGEEFEKYGGVGIAAVVAPPTEAARQA